MRGPDMGGSTIKTVNGRGYLYYSYWDDGKKVAQYCGRADDPNAQRKARELELADLKDLRDRVDKKIKALRSQM